MKRENAGSAPMTEKRTPDHLYGGGKGVKGPKRGSEQEYPIPRKGARKRRRVPAA